METTTPYDLYTYPNGLRLITVPLENTKSVTVLVLVGTGSRYETPSINGISHFLEHMMFKGTSKRPKSSQISHELDSIGADYNAFTSKEWTGYYVKCSTEKIDTAIDIISDIFQNSQLNADEIEKEKGVIIEEINMYLDNPSRYIHDIFEELLYGDQPLGWQIAGKKEIIRGLNREDFTNYFNSHYFDKNTVVTIAGNITPEIARQKVEKYFSDMREGKPIVPATTVESQKEPALLIHQKKTDQTHFKLGFRAFDYFDEKSEILNAMSVLLGGGMSSRLFEEFREKRGMAYYVSASNESYKDVGYFEVRAGVDNSRFMEAVTVSLEQCKRLAQELVSEEELKKVKDYIHGKTAISLETSDDWAEFFADQELLKNKIETPEQKLLKLEKVTPESIMSVAKEIFTKERMNLAVIGPFEGKDAEIKKILESF